MSEAPTENDKAVWTSLTGFTDHDVEIIARAVGVPERTVHRLIDCIRFVKAQGLSEQREAAEASRLEEEAVLV